VKKNILQQLEGMKEKLIPLSVCFGKNKIINLIIEALTQEGELGNKLFNLILNNPPLKNDGQPIKSEKLKKKLALAGKKIYILLYDLKMDGEKPEEALPQIRDFLDRLKREEKKHKKQ